MNPEIKMSPQAKKSSDRGGNRTTTGIQDSKRESNNINVGRRQGQLFREGRGGY